MGSSLDFVSKKKKKKFFGFWPEAFNYVIIKNIYKNKIEAFNYIYLSQFQF